MILDLSWLLSWVGPNGLSLANSLASIFIALALISVPFIVSGGKTK
jgi:ABC-type sulfate transport system permease component